MPAEANAKIVSRSEANFEDWKKKKKMLGCALKKVQVLNALVVQKDSVRRELV